MIAVRGSQPLPNSLIAKTLPLKVVPLKCEPILCRFVDLLYARDTRLIPERFAHSIIVSNPAA